MSSDNGIYILQTLDGYRVINAQAIDNIYWQFLCCDSPNIIEKENEDVSYIEMCTHCGTYNPKGVHSNKINLFILKDYFGDAQVFQTQERAMMEATRLYHDILDDDYGLLEYGISFIKGFEDKEFPK